MLFADSLRAELGKDNHAGILITSPSWDGIYVVDLKGSAPVLRVCVAHESEDKCSCWTCDLSDEIILNHVRQLLL